MPPATQSGSPVTNQEAMTTAAPQVPIDRASQAIAPGTDRPLTASSTADPPLSARSASDGAQGQIARKHPDEPGTGQSPGERAAIGEQEDQGDQRPREDEIRHEVDTAQHLTTFPLTTAAATTLNFSSTHLPAFLAFLNTPRSL